MRARLNLKKAFWHVGGVDIYLKEEVEGGAVERGRGRKRLRMNDKDGKFLFCE